MSFYLQNIKLTNFKNYSFIDLKLNPKFNAFVGLNGQGKTNLLDAVYYMSMVKSNFSAADRDVTKFEESFFRIEGNYQTDQNDTHKVIIKVQPGKLKEIEWDNKKYKKRSQHIGKIPIVIVTPDDLVDLLATSECRRKFLDTSLVQYDKEYLSQLMIYNRLLKQRNALLKQMGENSTWNEMLVKVLDDKMQGPSDIIYERRKEEALQLTPVFEEIYATLSDRAEACEIKYKSQLETSSLSDLLLQSREKDRILRRTTAGIHKDDIGFSLNGKKLSKFGSQGQLKSFVFALKLAQYHFLKSKKNIKPILLLDDIFDKLDDRRVKSLIKIISGEEYGQIFISNTSEDLIQNIFEALNLNHTIYHLEDGTLVKN